MTDGIDMDKRPPIDEFHEQDWLLIMEALQEWAEQGIEGEVTEEDVRNMSKEPRKVLAIQLRDAIGIDMEIPLEDYKAQIDPQWDGSER